MNGLLLGAWLSFCAGDAATTHVAMSRGAREVLLTSNPGANVAIIGGQGVVWAFAGRRLSKDRPKLARGVTIVLITVRAFAIYQNARVIREMR